MDSQIYLDGMKEKEKFLDTYKRATSEMIAKNGNNWDRIYQGSFAEVVRVRQDYTIEEVERIISSHDLQKQKQLSRYFFYKDGFYRRILVYYATLLKYVGILVPHPSFGKKLSTPHIKKKYFMAMDYVDRMNLQEVLTRFTLRALVDGAYYGILQKIDKERCVIFDLPSEYCRSRFLDFEGNDIIEFNVSYFSSIKDESMRKLVLSVYPEEVKRHYKKWRDSKVDTSWVCLPSNIGICFSFFESPTPPFLNVIPSTMQYDDAVDIESEKVIDEIQKIIVQKVPHLNDGTLLFEPDEAEVMHAGAVGMLGGNKNISVLTTYADVDAISSKTAADSNSNYLDNMVQNIYAKTGTSQELFSPKGAQALSMCINNDMAMMMIVANKYSRFITTILNKVFGNSNISFKYSILPVSYYNQAEYIVDAFKLAQSGYSFLVPAAALGIGQSDLFALKELENEVLDLDNVLIPLQSSYTQSYKSKLEDSAEKEEKTEEIEASEETTEVVQDEDSLKK